MSGQPASRGDDKVSRRDFLKLLAAAGTVVTFTPFIDWGKFLPNPAGSANEKGKVELPDGSQANVKTFKVNHAEAIIYPKSDDPVLNELCKKQGEYLYNKLYAKKHLSTIRLNARITKNKRRSELTDNIIINDIISSPAIIKRLGRPLTKDEITPTMIDVKRKSILLTRTLKDKYYE